MGRLAGKAALVTGAGGAIGGAIARRFAAEGAAVMCLDVSEASVRKTAADIESAGGRSVWRLCDVSDSKAVRAAVNATVAAFGKIDTVVNTAANNDPSGTIVELAEEEWNRAMAVNVTGVYIVCKHAIPKIAAAGGGSIVIVASQLGQVVVPRRPAYVTSKAALIQLARALALDHAKEKIRVNTVSPGAIETDRLLARYPDMAAARAALAPLHPIGRLGKPEEIANGALFLASDEASFMTGADLVIDGGYCAV